MQPIRLDRLGEVRLGLGRMGKCSIRIQCQFGVTTEYSKRTNQSRSATWDVNLWRPDVNTEIINIKKLPNV